MSRVQESPFLEEMNLIINLFLKEKRLMKSIMEIMAEATVYSQNYPGLDDETREAVFLSHLAYLINREIR